MNEVELISEHARMTLQLEEMAKREATLVEALEGLMKFAGIIEERCGNYETNKARQALTHKEER